MKNKSILTFLSILGFLCTINLAIVYYQSNYNPYATSSYCSINHFVDCDFVATTTKAVFLGIPLSYWGMFLYLFILILLYIEKLSSLKSLRILKVFKNPLEYISALGFISSFISIYLAITSLFVIQKICVLCFVTYVLNFLITYFSTEFTKEGLKKVFVVSFLDFIDGVKNYTKPFVIAVVLASMFLTYSTLAMPFASKRQSIKHFMGMKKNPYKAKGNLLGNKDGKIVVEVYTDYVCHHCRMYNIMLHKLVKENKNIKVIHHNFPLDCECNIYLDEQMNKGACRMARYAIAAENQGKYWEMASALFETRPKTDADAIKLAEKLGLNIEQFKLDIASGATLERLKQEIDDAISNQIDGTPTFVIRGKNYTGLKPYYEFKRIIEGK